MQSIRKAAVAGLFYPENPKELQRTVLDLLNNAGRLDQTSPLPKALIVPHAGYIYSGSTAADGFSSLLPVRDQIKRIILLGPSHRVGFQGLAVSNAAYFQTPLGDIKIDQQAVQQITQLPQVLHIEQAHELEHSLEVQLPFLQALIGDFTLVPIVVGDAGSHSVSEVLETLWGGDETLIVISSDLSHYHPYDLAQQIDTKTCRAIESLSPEAIGDSDACGRNPLKGLLLSAKKHHLTVTTLALRNSGDTAGDKSSVVGYGAWLFRKNMDDNSNE